MKKILPFLFLLSCGQKSDVTRLEPDSGKRIRELSLASPGDGTALTRELLPPCDRNCKLWLVEQPKEDLYFCHRRGEDWLQLRDYVGLEDTMYCSL